jgi:adenine/guanine phosphoribosyltransferase-like PRPP-binding protein
MRIFHCTYLKKVYENPAEYTKLVGKVARKIAAFRKKHPFDAIAFRGNSGAAFGYPLAVSLKIPPIFLRKRGEDCHSSYEIEGPSIDIQKYIIVDDLIASGKTTEKIVKGLEGAKCVGIFLYSSDVGDDPSYRVAGLTVPLFNVC